LLAVPQHKHNTGERGRKGILLFLLSGVNYQIDSEISVGAGLKPALPKGTIKNRQSLLNEVDHE
jgi:hypothetical protein